MSNAIKVALLGDNKDLSGSLDKGKADLVDFGSTAQKQSVKVESAFDRVAESSDNVASKGSQAAGALSGLGGLAQDAGGPFKGLGDAMVFAGGASQAMADAGDLLNVVTESTIVKQALAKTRIVATTVAKKGASAATKAWTVAQGALNVVMSANPIGLVVLAVVALVAIFVVAYKKSDKFREIVDKAFA